MNLNIQVFLDSLQNNEEFRNYCLQHFSEIRGDIISYTENPNCGCKKRLVEYFSLHADQNKVQNILNDWSSKIPTLDVRNLKNEEAKDKNIVVSSTPSFVSKSNINKIKEPKLMVGHIVEIPADPMSYKNFIEMTKMENWVYRGLTILEKEKDNNEKVWLIFLF